MARRAADLVQTDKEELALDLDLAKRLCTSMAGRPKQLWALAKESEVDVSAWLIETMMGLSHNGLLDDALALRKDLGMLLESIDRVVYRPLLLARAGRHEDAITDSKADLARTPDDPTVADYVADVLFPARRCGPTVSPHPDPQSNRIPSTSRSRTETR